jgi:hypothetical protein
MGDTGDLAGEADLGERRDDGWSRRLQTVVGGGASADELNLGGHG